MPMREPGLSGVYFSQPCAGGTSKAYCPWRLDLVGGDGMKRYVAEFMGGLCLPSGLDISRHLVVAGRRFTSLIFG